LNLLHDKSNSVGMFGKQQDQEQTPLHIIQYNYYPIQKW